MKIILILFLCISLLSGCSSNRALSLNMLDKRADYHGLGHIDQELSSMSDSSLSSKRARGATTDIWIHHHKMATGDYFRGGWIRIMP